MFIDEQIGCFKCYYVIHCLNYIFLCIENHCILDVDVPVCRKSCGKPAVERILEFGRELHSMNQRLKLEQNCSENNEKMLTVSFDVVLLCISKVDISYYRRMHLVY